MWEVLLRGAARLPEGRHLALDGGVDAEILVRRERGSAQIRFHGRGAGGLLAHAERSGSIPLPPYIEAARKRLTVDQAAASVEVDDKVRYQTVFARAPGAVAAPTAGLHFTEALLDQLTGLGHEIAKITLHVGPGTFRPVEVDDPAEHPMDPEHYEVSPAAASALSRARAEGRPIVAVGTTVVRTLEAIARCEELEAGAAGSSGGAEPAIRPRSGATDLFLTPGARFALVTDLITNFHLPRSTLLMLVAAFAGRQAVLDAYADAVERGYRFYSYGDAMFLSGHDRARQPG
jgi:S-adenosylmethionine:tRNA ribosyltransferase-isomerase